MGVDKNTFRYRLSNVIAWIGLLGGTSLLFFLALCLLVLIIGEDLGNWEEIIFPLLAVYLGCAIVNYLMIGRFRFLPWLDVADPIPVPFNGKMTKQAKDTIKKWL